MFSFHLRIVYDIQACFLPSQEINPITSQLCYDGGKIYPNNYMPKKWPLQFELRTYIFICLSFAAHNNGSVSINFGQKYLIQKGILN